MKTFLSIIEGAPQIVKDKLEQLKGLRERPDYHPEPSTFHHIEIVTDRLIQTGDNDLIFAGILHDICKLDCKVIDSKTGQPTSPGHDKAAHDLIHSNREIRQWITDNDADWEKVVAIVFGHMRFHQLEKMRPFKRDKQIQDWIDQGIYEKLRFHGAADNMLVAFDINNLEKSFKSREDEDVDDSHELDRVMNSMLNDIKENK